MTARREYYDWKDVQGMTQDLIQQTSHLKFDSVIGLTRGGLTPAVLISHYLGIPMYPLKVGFRDHAGQEQFAANGGLLDQHSNLQALIIDDINDSGATINHIKQHWQLNNLTFAVLINNTSSEAEVDYSCVEINKREDDVWIVFAWEDWWKWKK